jgi:hypothetical protein
MAGLDPAIQVFRLLEQDVDARDKRGHDGGGGCPGLVFFILHRN